MDKKDNCPVEATLELIGGKYKALILWHLSENKLRFNELRKVITSATPKMLTQQLRELEAQHLIHREKPGQKLDDQMNAKRREHGHEQRLEGKILEEGSPEDIFENPKHERVREFIGGIGAI